MLGFRLLRDLGHHSQHLQDGRKKKGGLRVSLSLFLLGGKYCQMPSCFTAPFSLGACCFLTYTFHKRGEDQGSPMNLQRHEDPRDCAQSYCMMLVSDTHTPDSHGPTMPDTYREVEGACWCVDCKPIMYSEKQRVHDLTCLDRSVRSAAQR